jgi:hypothetical protein
VLPGVVGDAVELGDADVEPTELRRRRQTDRHGTAVLDEASRGLARVVGDPVGEDQGRTGVGPTLHLVELLHADRDAAEGLRDVGRAGGLQGPFRVEERERVEVARLDGGQRRLEFLHRGPFAGAERLHQ